MRRLCNSDVCCHRLLAASLHGWLTQCALEPQPLSTVAVAVGPAAWGWGLWLGDGALGRVEPIGWGAAGRGQAAHREEECGPPQAARYRAGARGSGLAG
jgi:hypothetical protein